MAKKHFDDQFDDEEVMFVFRKHPIVMRKGLLLAAFGPLIGILPATINMNLGLGWFFGGMAAGFLLGLLLMFPSWINWYFSITVVTSQRLIQIKQRGLFNRSVGDLGLNHIQTMNYEIKGIEQTLFGFGTITIQTYMGDVVIHSVYKPARVLKNILEVMKEFDIEPLEFPVADKIKA